MSCISQIAQNILPDCENPKVAGFEGRAIVIGYSDFVTNSTITFVSDSKTKIETIDLDGQGKRAQIYGENPYNGTNEALTREDGVEKYIHQVALRIADRGADAGDNIVAPLARGRHVVFQVTNDGKVFVHGLYGVLKANEQTQNEYENNGDWMVTLQDSEPYPVVEVVGTVARTALQEFEVAWNAIV